MQYKISFICSAYILKMLTPERQRACRNLFREYYQSLCKHLIREHKDLKVVERQNRKILHTKGEISQERKEHYDGLLSGYQKLYSNTAIFAVSLLLIFHIFVTLYLLGHFKTVLINLFYFHWIIGYLLYNSETIKTVWSENHWGWLILLSVNR